jgi:hypothetical protein
MSLKYVTRFPVLFHHSFSFSYDSVKMTCDSQRWLTTTIKKNRLNLSPSYLLVFTVTTCGIKEVFKFTNFLIRVRSTEKDYFFTFTVLSAFHYSYFSAAQVTSSAHVD